MGKQLTENSQDMERYGLKNYFRSQGLYEPVEIRENTRVKAIVKALPESQKDYETSFQNDFTGQVKLKQYLIERKQKKPR
nr:hypothetical protein [Desulforamulus aquiferis]